MPLPSALLLLLLLLCLSQTQLLLVMAQLEVGPYVFFNTSLSWEAAETACGNAMGTNLGTIRSSKDMAVLTQMIGPTIFWFGLNDQGDGSTFRYASGLQVGYTDWGPGQPVLKAGQCAQVAPPGLWFVAECGQARAYICDSSSLAFTPFGNLGTTKIFEIYFLPVLALHIIPFFFTQHWKTRREIISGLRLLLCQAGEICFLVFMWDQVLLFSGLTILFLFLPSFGFTFLMLRWAGIFSVVDQRFPAGIPLFNLIKLAVELLFSVPLSVILFPVNLFLVNIPISLTPWGRLQTILFFDDLAVKANQSGFGNTLRTKPTLPVMDEVFVMNACYLAKVVFEVIPIFVMMVISTQSGVVPIGTFYSSSTILFNIIFIIRSGRRSDALYRDPYELVDPEALQAAQTQHQRQQRQQQPQPQPQQQQQLLQPHQQQAQAQAQTGTTGAGVTKVDNDAAHLVSLDNIPVAEPA